ncbi:alpha-protein kinase vwkA-like [Patiria miniata]|uniref:Alpha-type protein kinase domain-containing protein n=1 Tax=Patiria miniata TaxID=46514 RepID=A0A914AGN3_PATMI|nr:alpha-protein kinase vwkA-like [Patiria miniata]
MGSYQSNSCHPIEGTNRWVEFENDWFAEGRSRRAYRGTYKGDWRVEGKKCVVKIYKEVWCERIGELAYKADIRASERAQEMARAFNQMYPSIESIEFIQPEISKINSSSAFMFLGFIPFHKKVKGKRASSKDTSTEMIPEGDTVAIEKYLRGKFTSFLSNSGYETVPSAVPAAFSHFTFHHSHGKILVCDLKGVREDHGYVFTDPAIHSSISAFQYGFFGPTDLGDIGMIKFFQNHKCNDLCSRFLQPVLESVMPRHESLARHIGDSNATVFNCELLRRCETATYELSSLAIS